MIEASGAVGNPIDGGQYLGSTQPQELGSGWTKVFGFLDGVRGVTDRSEAIVNDVASISDTIVGAKRKAFELKRDEDSADQDQFLEKVTTLRGDNVTQMYVIGGVAVALVAIVFLK